MRYFLMDFVRFFSNVGGWASKIFSALLPLKKYDIMVYKELSVSYMVSFLVISLVVWLKEIYFIYIQYIQKGAQFWTTLKIFLFSLPFSMAITIPASMVMASLLTFNKFSLNLEILTLRCSGVRKFRLFLPVFVFSIFITILTYVFFDTVLVKGNEMYLRSMIEMRVEKPFIDIAPGEFPKIGNFNIGFDDVAGDELVGLEIYDKENRVDRLIKAERGKIVSTTDLPYYKILLIDGTFIERMTNGEVFSSQFKRAELRIDYEVSYIPSFDVRLQPRVMSRYKTGKIIKEMEKDPSIRNYLARLNELNAKLFYEFGNLVFVLPGYLFELVFGGKGENIKKFEKLRDSVYKINLDIRVIRSKPEVLNYNIFVFEQHKKTSIPISSVVYALIGFVFGIMFKVRTGKGGSLVIGIIVVLVQTYLTFIAEIPIRNGSLDPIIGAWYSNVLLFVPAFYLMVREKI
ncbi:MAG: LptF/LptG family permease [Brevinematia bacterium]